MEILTLPSEVRLFSMKTLSKVVDKLIEQYVSAKALIVEVSETVVSVSKDRGTVRNEYDGAKEINTQRFWYSK